MNNWKELHIGNEVNILSGHPFDSKKFNTDKEGKPLIRIRDILESSISTYFSGSYSDTFLIKKEDILVGMDGDFHVAKWNNIDALLNQRILKVHQKKGAKIFAFNKYHCILLRARIKSSLKYLLFIQYYYVKNYRYRFRYNELGCCLYGRGRAKDYSKCRRKQDNSICCCK